ncbi:hypothetical protein ISCGN_007938 [Ixodes scapularis]
MAKDNRQRHCFVPGCRSGYVTPHSKGQLRSQKLSLFAVPTDDNRFQAWQRALARFDKPLQKRCVLCELHFDNRFILRTYRHTIQGEVVEIPRTRPSLAPDAVPTLFLNPPRPTRAKRRLPRRAAQTPKSDDGGFSEDAARDDSGSSDGSASPVAEPKRTVTPHIVTARRASPVPAKCTATDGPTLTELRPLVLVPYATPPAPCPVPAPPTTLELDAPAFVASFDPSWLPNRYWTMHHVQHGSQCVAFSFCTLLGGQPAFTKLLACHEERDCRIRCESSIQGTPVRTATVTTALEVCRLIEELDGLKLCEGAAASDEFALSNLPPCKADQGKLRSASCNRTCASVSRACDHCKYLRKLLQNKASYHKRKAGGQPPNQPLPDGTVVVEALKTPQTAEHTGEEEWTLECTFYPVS